MKEYGESQDSTCNPVALGTGNKYLIEKDYIESGVSTLSLYRTYNSALSNRNSYDLARQWSISLYRGIQLDSKTSPSVALMVRPDGKALRFTRNGSSWIPDADIADRLSPLNGGSTLIGWQYWDAATQAVEIYDSSGLLLEIIENNSRAQQFSYSDGSSGILYATDPHASGYQAPVCNRPAGFATFNTSGVLLCVTDSYGRQLNFDYDNRGLITQVNDPLDRITHYSFDDYNNLVSVTYPDGHNKTYHYEDSAHPNALTGITDENEAKYATYGYDSQGRASSENLAGGAGAASLAFDTNSTTVTDALGTSRTYNFQTILGVQKNTGASQPAGSGSGASSSAIGYDANGNVSSRTDFNGFKTTYAYELTRNLETQRIEGLNGDGSSRPETRTISTQWHSYWRMPVKLAEPKKLTTYSYNGDGGIYCASTDATVPSINGGTQPIGVLCSKTEQATSDATGSQGFNATVTGNPRTWNYSYGRYGQVLKADGPRTDVSDVTSYSYHPDDDPDLGKRGNLATVTGALGHITRITAYDAHGRPLTVIDPNGVTLTFTYTPRGWLKTRSVDGKTTTYDYDNVGQLKKITQPDGSWIEYTYDDAHRLTDVSDAALNNVHYALDPLGNITQITWSNSDGSTAKSTSANYDPLGRLHNAIATRDAVEYATTYGYDANGNLKTTTNPKAKTTSTQYDALNRPTRVTDALAGLITLAYDARDQLVGLQAPNQAPAHQTTFTVDGLGNITNETSADRGSSTATYDAAGNLLTRSDARGVAETRTWDALNRPLTVSYPQVGESITYTWDTGCAYGIGRLCQVTDNGGTTAFAYDARGNLVSETRIEGGITLPATQYAYDTADRLNTVIAPTGKVLTAGRDLAGRIESVSTTLNGSNLDVVSDVKTDAAGNLTTLTFGNGTVQTNTYHTDGRPAILTSAAVTPWLQNLGPLFDYNALVAATPSIGLQEPGWHIVADDFDHDGDIDLFLYFMGGNEMFCNINDSFCELSGPEFGNPVYLENVGGTYIRRAFSNNDDIVKGDIERMIPLDYNNDGKIDLLMVMNPFYSYSTIPPYMSDKPYRRLVLFKNDTGVAYVETGNSNGTHFSDVTATVGLDKAIWYAEGLVLDLNGDGYLDILGNVIDANYIHLGDAFVFNPVTGTYAPATIAGLPRPLWLAALADLDGDTRPDIVAQDGAAGLRFFSNDGNLAFTELINTQNLSGLVGTWFAKFVSADIDNDGRSDIVTFETDISGEWPAQIYDGVKIRWLRNEGMSGNQITVTLQTTPLLELGSDPYSGAIAFGGSVGDLNNDGWLDVVLAGGQLNQEPLAMADGMGGYVRLEAAGVITGLTPYFDSYIEPTFIDFDLDGKADLLAARSLRAITNGHYLLRNTGVAGGSNNGISIELTGQNRATSPSAGRDAYGTKVEVIAGGQTYTKYLLPVMGQSRRLHFGLGAVSSGLMVRIYWPDNPTSPQILTGAAIDAKINSLLRVTQP